MHAALRLASREPTRAVAAAEMEPRVSDEMFCGPELAALISQAQLGDIAAFERLMSMYQSKILSFSRAFVDVYKRQVETGHRISRRGSCWLWLRFGPGV